MERESAKRIIGRARKGAGLTQQQLADRAGVTQPSIAAYETGRRQPTLPTLYRLLAAAGYIPRIQLERMPEALTTEERAGPRRSNSLTAAATAGGIRTALRRGDPAEALRWVAQLIDGIERAPAALRPKLVARRPLHTGEQRWDAMLAGAVEHVSHRVGLPVPPWSVEPDRFLDRFWFVIESVLGRPSPALAVSAFMESPPALANRGVFVHASSLESV